MKTKLFFIAMALCNFGISQKPDNGMVLLPAGKFNMGKITSMPSDWQPENKIEDIK
jgi:hypothetical protein